MIEPLTCELGQTIALSGYAIDFGHAIVAVQFSLDHGAHWTTYEVRGARADRRVNWTFDFRPQDRGRFTMLVRSVNDAGHASPEEDFAEFEVI